MTSCSTDDEVTRPPMEAGDVVTDATSADVVASGSVGCIATLEADVAGAGLAALRGVGTMIELVCIAELPTKGDEESLEDAGTGTFTTGREACVVVVLIGWEEGRTADTEASVGVEGRATVTTDEGDDGEVEASVGGEEKRAIVPEDDGDGREEAPATVTMNAGADGDDGEADKVLMVLLPGQTQSNQPVHSHSAAAG